GRGARRARGRRGCARRGPVLGGGPAHGPGRRCGRRGWFGARGRGGRPRGQGRSAQRARARPRRARRGRGRADPARAGGARGRRRRARPAPPGRGTDRGRGGLADRCPPCRLRRVRPRGARARRGLPAQPRLRARAGARARPVPHDAPCRGGRGPHTLIARTDHTHRGATRLQHRCKGLHPMLVPGRVLHANPVRNRLQRRSEVDAGRGGGSVTATDETAPVGLPAELDTPFWRETFALHRGGKLAVTSRVPLADRADLAKAYTPGVAAVCEAIARDVDLSFEYTGRSNSVAVVSDGSAVLGLGRIGPEASMPVLEGKAVLFKAFAGVDAIPVALDLPGVDRVREFVDAVTAIAPSFGGINLEDVAAPECFEIEAQLAERLDIPVFHDDQHGTAVVVLAGLLNASRATGRALGELRVVVLGAGAAGVACTKILLAAGVGDVAVVDSRGVIGPDREGLTGMKAWLARSTNRAGL